jgi:hypothetical protein
MKPNGYTPTTNGSSAVPPAAPPAPLRPGERPPIDPDAT